MAAYETIYFLTADVTQRDPRNNNDKYTHKEKDKDTGNSSVNVSRLQSAFAHVHCPLEDNTTPDIQAATQS